MPWQMQIKTPHQSWKSIRPTDGPIYEYHSKQDAIDMFIMCYPDLILGFYGDGYDARVIEAERTL